MVSNMRRWAGHLWKWVTAISVAATMTACHTAAPMPTAEKSVRPMLTIAEQNRFDRLFGESIRQRAAGNKDAQFALLRMAGDIDPTSPEVAYALSKLYADMSRVGGTDYKDTVTALLEKAYRAEPANADYQEALASQYSNSGKYGQAQPLLADLYLKRPNEERLRQLVVLCDSNRSYGQAVRYIEELERREGMSEYTAIEKYRLFSLLNDDEHAFKAIEDLCAQNPYELKYRVLLGDLYAQVNHTQQALDVYQDVLAAEPNNSFAQLSMLAYYKNTRQDSLYEASVRRIIANPATDNAVRNEALYGYMRVCHEQNGMVRLLPVIDEMLDSARVDNVCLNMCNYYIDQTHLEKEQRISLLRKMLVQDPGFNEVRERLLQEMDMVVGSVELVELCRDGMYYNPDQPVYYYYFAVFEIESSNDEAALKTLQDGFRHADAENNPEGVGLLYSLAGSLCYTKGRKDEAFEYMDKAVELNKSDALLYNNLAYYLACEKRDLDRALRLSDYAMKLDPSDVNLLDTYAWVLYNMERYDEALIYMEQLFRELEGADHASISTFYEHAGDICSRLRRTSEAVRYWRKALEKSDDNKQISDLKRKIKRRSL